MSEGYTPPRQSLYIQPEHPTRMMPLATTFVSDACSVFGVLLAARRGGDVVRVDCKHRPAYPRRAARNPEFAETRHGYARRVRRWQEEAACRSSHAGSRSSRVRRAA